MGVRILDIAVAATYGILCLSVISFMGPFGPESASAQADQEAIATSAVFGYVRSVGLPFLGTAPPHQICSSLQSSSNSTLMLGGSVDENSCSAPPAHYLACSNLTIVFSGREVDIEAWVEGQ